MKKPDKKNEKHEVGDFEDEIILQPDHPGGQGHNLLLLQVQFYICE